MQGMTVLRAVCPSLIPILKSSGDCKLFNSMIHNFVTVYLGAMKPP